jgi:hypothetical protein
MSDLPGEDLELQPIFFSTTTFETRVPEARLLFICKVRRARPRVLDYLVIGEANSETRATRVSYLTSVASPFCLSYIVFCN